MNLFFGVIVFLIAVVAVFVLAALLYIRKKVIRIKKIMTGDLDDEEMFKRMADKHYRGNANDPKFGKDYFKSAGSTSGKKYKQQQQTTHRTTTTTADGVTIIDDRPHEDRRNKIFNEGEGEYVDYEVVD